MHQEGHEFRTLVLSPCSEVIGVGSLDERRAVQYSNSRANENATQRFRNGGDTRAARASATVRPGK